MTTSTGRSQRGYTSPRRPDPLQARASSAGKPVLASRIDTMRLKLLRRDPCVRFGLVGPSVGLLCALLVGCSANVARVPTVAPATVTVTVTTPATLESPPSSHTPTSRQATAPLEQLSGTWSGAVTQSGSGTYTIRVTLSSAEGTVEGRVEYPELACGGSWRLITQSSSVYSFEEVITYGSRCVERVDVQISVGPGNQLHYRIEPPYAASATLLRDEGPSVSGEAPASAGVGWPTAAEDAPPALMAWFGAAWRTGNSSVGFPKWVSCVEGYDVCIAGGESTVGVIQRGSGGFYETHTIPIDRPARDALLAVGLSAERVDELLRSR